MREITPPKFLCAAEDECPAVFEDGDDLIIIGKIEPEPHEVIARKIGHGETAVRVSRDLLRGLV